MISSASFCQSVTGNPPALTKRRALATVDRLSYCLTAPGWKHDGLCSRVVTPPGCMQHWMNRGCTDNNIQCECSSLVDIFSLFP